MAKLHTQMSWGGIAQSVYVASQFVTVIGLTRFTSINEVAQYGLASAIVIPIFYFFGLGMRVNVASAHSSSFGFREFRFLLLLSLAVGYLIVVAIGAVAFEGSQLVMLFILGATKAAECISEFCYGVFQRHGRMNLVGISIMLRATLGSGLFLLLLWIGVPTAWALTAQFFVWTAIALVFDHSTAKKFAGSKEDQKRPQLERLRTLAVSTLPLALNRLMAGLQGNMPRYVIATLVGSVAMAHFVVVAYVITAMVTVTGAAMDSIVAQLSRFVADGKRTELIHTLARVLLALAIVGLIGVVIALLIGDELIEAVFGAEYGGLGGLSAICIIAGVLNSSLAVLQTGLLAGRRFWLVLRLRIYSIFTMAIACILGALLGGLNGVTIGMCFAFMVFFANLAVATNRLVPSLPSQDAR